MAEQKFENGAVVQLKSGGPLMTVVDYAVYELGGSEPEYKVTWFEKNQVKQAHFSEAILRRVD